MNDSQEFRWLTDVMTPRYLNSIPQNNASFDYGELHHQLKTESAGINIYCACFSEHWDQLSQWVKYADDATGFSIGFNSRYFSRNEMFEPIKVFYDEGRQRGLIHRAFLGAQEMIGINQRDFAKRRAIWCAGAIWHHAARCKHPGFAEEAEWRIIYQPSSSAFSDVAQLDEVLTVKGNIAKSHQRVRNDQQINYFKLELNPTEQPIFAIRLGAKNREEEADVTRWLGENGFDIRKISRSKIPYR